MKKILLVLIFLAGIANATTYAEPIYKKCSVCAGVIEVEQLQSGNTFGAKYWTDGRRESPMLPDSLWFVKCPHCKVLFWIDEQQVVERTSYAKKYLEPNVNDYYKALNDDSLSEEKERYLRIRAWWKSNDQWRRSQSNLPLSMEEIDNLNKLFILLPAEKYIFMRSEIKRELGEFELASEILDELTSTKSKEVESFMRELIEKNNTFVKEIKFDDWGL